MRKIYSLIVGFALCFSTIHPFKAQTPSLWGLTANGGDGLGTLFSLNTGSTAISSQYNFQGYPGNAPQFVKPCLASNGKLYGTTRFGGTNNLGVLFEYNPANNSYSVIVDFDGTAKGSDPYNSVIQASNGKLYGLTRLGGVNNVGVLFEYDLSTSTFTKKYDMVAASGQFPQASLIEASNGRLYGVTRFGGSSGAGTLFEYNLGLNSYSVLVSFSTAIGANPQAPPIQASNGKIYGTTLVGGSGSGGVIYEYDLGTSTYSVVFNYTSAITGNQPIGGLIQASNGRFYGTTNAGGPNALGVLFEFNPAGNTYSVLSAMSSTLGANPQAALMQAGNGKLYGTTRVGGANNLGTLYEFDITGNTHTKLFDFSSVNGSFPLGAVTQATNGLLYGLTSAGGTQSVGVLYEYNISLSSYTKKIDLNTSSGGFPNGSLLHAANDKLYGMTSAGGTATAGVIFEYDMGLSTYTKKIDLTTANGSQPSGGLIQAPNGKLYGMTRLGGASGLGTIFEYDYSLNTYLKRIDLTAANGSQPYGSLCLASNGKMYGVTNLGGVNSLGVLFEYDYINNIYIKRVDLSSAIGSNPFGTLIQATNGKLYGLTRNGGANGVGAIFEYAIGTNTYSKVVDFTSAGGAQPEGSLIQASNGKMYGLTSAGGTNSVGVLFEFDPSNNTYSKLYDFSAANGQTPRGSLRQAANGKLYGLTQAGGTNGLGVVFEYDIVGNTYTKKLDLSLSSGNSPLYTQLIEVCRTPTISGLISSSFNSMCQGNTGVQTFGIPAVAGATAYAWTFPAGASVISGSTTNLVNVNFAGVVGGVYNVSVTATNQCGTGPSSAKSVTILAAPSISVNSGAICNGQSFTLVPSGGVSYTYSGGSSVVSPTTNTTYSVSGTGSNGCVSLVSAVSNLTVNPLPVITVNSGTVCSGQPFTMSPGGASTYTFSSGSAIVSPTTTTSYSVTGTSPEGCVSSLAAVSNVTVIALPVISVNSGSICSGNSFTINPSGATTYTFSSGSNIVSPTVTASYSVVGTGTNGCVSVIPAISNVTVNSLPILTVNSGAICSGASFTMVPTGALTYTFSSGTNVVSPLVNSSYSVTGTDALGCISAVPAISNVTVNSLPVITVNSGAICNGSSFTIVPSGASTYTYSGGSNVVSPTVNTNYSVTGTSAFGCVSSSAAISSVTVNNLPLLSVNSGSICSGNSFTLNPSGALTYTYSGGSQIVSPLTTTVYSITGTDGNGCVSASPAISNVTVQSLPVITVNSGAICSGASFVITPSGAVTYTFSGGSSIVSPTINTTYSVTGTNSLGCVSSVPALSNVTVNPLPLITVNSGTICNGSSFTIVPNGASTYTYSGGSNVVSPSSTTFYNVIGTSSLGCVSGAPAISFVTVNNLPILAVNSGTICTGNSFTLNPSGALTYTYSSGSPIVNPTITTLYSVIGTNVNGCVSATPAISTVTVFTRPVISVNSGAICLNTVFTITPSGALTYTYSGGSNTVSPLVNSTYSVTGTNSLGCVSSSPAISSVSVNPLPVITVNSGTTCVGVTFTLLPSGANTYTYSGGSNLVNPTITTTYSVTGTSSLGCLSAAPAISTVTAVPLPFITVNNGTICNTSSFTLIPNGASTYTFSSGSPVVSPSVTTTYSVTGTSSLGCLSSNTAVTTITVFPRPFITVNSGSICATRNFTMVPSGAQTYTYSSGSNIVTPLTSTFYTVIGTSAFGCLSSNTAVANVSVAPAPTITVNSGSICAGNVFTMTPSGAVTYTFFNGTNTISPVVNTSYSVTGTSSIGCVSPIPGVSQVSVVALPNVLISGTNNVCSGSSTSLTASGAQAYSWSTGASGSLVVVSPTTSTNYSVVGVAANGCSKVTSFAINALPLPTVSISNGIICPGNSFVLSPTGALSYTYSSGSATVFAASTSSYSVIGSDANGCVSANPAIATVSVVNTLTVTVSGNTTICEGESTNLIANGASTYTWSTGAISNTISLTPSVTTNYSVVGSSGSCSDSTDVTITVNPLPILQVSSTASIICVNEGAELNVTGALNYTWSNQQTGNVIFVTPTITTTYSVQGTDVNNCSNTSVITLSVSDCVTLSESALSSTSIQIFPNPHSGKFYVELPEYSKVSVCNLLGELMFTKEAAAGIHEFDMERYAKGIYIITIQSKGQTLSRQLIQQ
jgi:uncharacterized repeat protein (TIGR03803 family)